MAVEVESSMLNLGYEECWLNIKQLKLTSKDKLLLFYVGYKTYVVVLLIFKMSYNLTNVKIYFIKCSHLL